MVAEDQEAIGRQSTLDSSGMLNWDRNNERTFTRPSLAISIRRFQLTVADKVSMGPMRSTEAEKVGYTQHEHQATAKRLAERIPDENQRSQE